MYVAAAWQWVQLQCDAQQEVAVACICELQGTYLKVKAPYVEEGASKSAFSACKMYILPPDAVEGLQHPREFAHPQCSVEFGDDCTHRSHSQLHAVEELTACCSSKWTGEKQARDLASGNHHQASESGLRTCTNAPPRLSVVPQPSCN